jgi:hypothetical protein
MPPALQIDIYSSLQVVIGWNTETLQQHAAHSIHSKQTASTPDPTPAIRSWSQAPPTSALSRVTVSAADPTPCPERGEADVEQSTRGGEREEGLTPRDLRAGAGSQRGPRRRRPRAAPWAPPPLRRRGRGPPGRPHSAAGT